MLMILCSIHWYRYKHPSSGSSYCTSSLTADPFQKVLSTPSYITYFILIIPGSRKQMCLSIKSYISIVLFHYLLFNPSPLHIYLRPIYIPSLKSSSIHYHQFDPPEILSSFILLKWPNHLNLAFSILLYLC